MMTVSFYLIFMNPSLSAFKKEHNISYEKTPFLDDVLKKAELFSPETQDRFLKVLEGEVNHLIRCEAYINGDRVSEEAKNVSTMVESVLLEVLNDNEKKEYLKKVA